MIRTLPVESDECLSLESSALDVLTSKKSFASDGTSGGDRVDVVDGPDGTLHFVILDLCGHGENVAPLADMALHTVRALLWQGLRPARVFTLLNELLLDQSLFATDNAFGSGALATINSNRSAMTFCSAGHVDSLCFQQNGRFHRHFVATGPLYGVDRNARYEERTLSFSAGDVFVMLTDGLLDVNPIERKGTQLGTSGACDVVRRLMHSQAGLSAHHLIAAIRRIAGGSFTDDVAALVAAFSEERSVDQ